MKEETFFDAKFIVTGMGETGDFEITENYGEENEITYEIDFKAIQGLLCKLVMQYDDGCAKKFIKNIKQISP